MTGIALLQILEVYVVGDELFAVTRDIYVGRFASRERISELHALKVTDIVNVSDTPNQLEIDDGAFRSIKWIEIADRTLIPVDDAMAGTDAIHEAISLNGGRVYVHCMAGWNRSPTIIWLYLLACGIERDTATELICANAYDAVPGHRLLVDSNLIDRVVTHGLANYCPHSRSDSLAP